MKRLKSQVKKWSLNLSFLIGRELEKKTDRVVELDRRQRAPKQTQSLVKVSRQQSMSNACEWNRSKTLQSSQRHMQGTDAIDEEIDDFPE
jgi:hypothetical protein